MIPKEIRDHYDEIRIKRGDRIDHVTILDKYAALKINNGYSDHYCGYTWIEKSKVPEEWWEYSNIPYDLDIHGGLTYSDVVGDYVIYGFDCAHLNDENDPRLQDETFILELCQVMRSEILSAIPCWCKDMMEEITKIERELKKFGG
jgi:hypothetical protein